MDKRVPEVRFKGFTDDWEQRKLSDISIKIKTKNTKNLILPVFTNSALLGIVYQRDFFDKDIAKNIQSYYVVNNNDFVYNPRISNIAPYGPIRRNKLKKTGVMSPLYYVFRFNKYIDTNFMEFYFTSSSWYKFMYLNGDSGARSDRFAIKDNVFQTMPINIPASNEQYKIGILLSKIDNAIVVHQRKIDLLNKTKSFFLKKLFI